ncbi:hypothetical protein H6P81_002187 [Aristolochia fimbriata]|uniref:Uncharacterized protein n=1 Tax=Aristolochia fimbriata TaxID=158543 RepID=A0AAV7F9N0_ARIFI|nr:hypothetical protein H6P81_002187 [Aristolochia fimbriata]
MIAGLTCGNSGLVHLSFDKRFPGIQRFSRAKLCNLDELPLSPQQISTRWNGKSIPKYLSVKCSVYGRANRDFEFDDEFREDPFWLSFIKEALGAVRSLLAFLVEQPSQLKYIEWPTFQSTFKTATLTLVLVAIFIVSLASVDSALCFLLSLCLRRKA